MLTPRELKAWLKYYATRGAYCPACGAKSVDDLPWIWILPGRVYLICKEDALGWAGGRGVIQPEQVQAFLDGAKWRKAGSGLEVVAQ
jgi:hypothetical protein